MPARVLVLDGNQRAALAITRSLGRAGYQVVTADEGPRTLAGASRHSSAELVYPAPQTAAAEFLSWAESAIAKHSLDAAMPVTEITTDLLLRHRTRWPSLRLPFAPIEMVDALSDKVRLYQRALEVGVPAPRSIIVESLDDVERAVEEIGFPAVLKPRRSRLRTQTGFISTTVRRIACNDDLEAHLHEEAFQDFPYLYQQQVAGQGEGIFALYRHGEAVAFFSHRRLREKPPEGGVSVLSESRAPDPALLSAAKRLLDDAHWHGVAMVEFKVDPHDGPFLMEINARFWGSLQLAIDAGVDFPRLLMDSSAVALGSTYRQGQRLRWLLGDLDRLYLLTKNRKRYPKQQLLLEWLRFLRPHSWATRNETFRWNDPAPAFREMLQYLSALRP